MSGYQSFAEFYDGLMEDARYSDRCDYLLELLKRHGHEAGITLDLACGTGSLTIELKKRGVDVYGVDASVDMLSEAMQKSLEQGFNILFLNQKMQELDLYGTVDTCVCTLDSINHITDSKTLEKAFDRVGLFMNSGGLFVFDVNVNSNPLSVWMHSTLMPILVNSRTTFLRRTTACITGTAKALPSARTPTTSSEKCLKRRALPLRRYTEISALSLPSPTNRG